MSHNRTFRVFISSTFEDFQTERELLRSRVWPELENYCTLRGATFEAIDLRWGIPANSAEDLDIVAICLDEVERCKKLSPRPNFIAMIGNRYGWRPLPATVPFPVVQQLPSEGRALINLHYLLDDNASTPTYLVNKETITGPEHENEIIEKIRRSAKDMDHIPEIQDYFFKSATHLEIDDGIFKSGIKDQEDHFFACFRKIRDFESMSLDTEITSFSKKFIDVKPGIEWEQDSDANQWLQRLKSDIEKKLENKPDQLETYQTSLADLSDNSVAPYMENMCSDIESWLKHMIDKELSDLEKVDSLEIERLEHQQFRDIRNQTFGGRQTLLREIKEKFKREIPRNVVCIHGGGGSGKSALMSRLISDTELEFPDARIVYRFVGATPASVDLNPLLGGIVDQFDSPSEPVNRRITREEHIAAFQNCLASTDGKTKTILFVDALDQLNNTENAHSLYWLPQAFSEDIILVISVLNGKVFDSFRKIYPGAAYFDLSPEHRSLESEEMTAMLSALLSKKPARTLQDKQLSYILESFRKNPLMLNLKLIAENARHWHSFDTIETIEAKSLGIKENVDQQIRLLFDRLSQENNHGPVFVKDVLAIVALSREGASDKEIQSILWEHGEYRKEFDERKHKNQPEVNALPPIIWSRFFFEIQPFLMERSSGGTIVLDFFHRHFKEVVKAEISDVEAKEFHHLIADYFADKKTQNTRFITHDGNVVFNARKITELPFHQSAAGLMDKVYQTLTDFVFLEAKVKLGKSYELMEDFQQALVLDSSKDYPILHFLATAYRNDINFIAHHPPAFFQSMYNSCWWHDHPGRSQFYSAPLQESPNSGQALYSLMESWEKEKASLEPGFFWLRALQPPSVELEGAQLGLLRGLSSPVIFVSYSTGGEKIFAVCNRGELITWNADTRSIEQFLPLPHEKSFMFKPNSKKRFDKNTEIKSEAGGVLADHPGFEYWAWSGIISTDGKSFLSGSFDGEVSLLEFSERGSEEFQLQLAPSVALDKLVKRPVRGMAFSGNKLLAATGHADGSLVIWDLVTKTSIAFLQHEEGWVNSVAMDTNAENVVSAGGDGIVYVWQREKEESTYKLTLLKGHSDRIWSVAISENGRYAASGSDDKSVRIWDLKLKKEVKKLVGHTRWVQALAFNHKNNVLASSGGDGKIFLWDVEGPETAPKRQLPGHDDSVLSLSFSDNDQLLLSGSRDQSVRIWDMSAEAPVSQVTGHTDRITCAAFSSDGQILATGSNDKTIRVWETASGKPAASLSIGESISDLKISNNNQFILVGTDGGDVFILQRADLKIINRLQIHKARIYSLDISADSKLVVSTSQDGSMKLWHLRTREIITTVEINEESILSVAFSPDYSHVVVGTRSGCVKLFSLKQANTPSYSFKEKISEMAFKSWVDEVVFSRDGTKIEARGGSWDDRKILVLDASTLKETGQYEKLADGPVGSFGKYRLGFGSTELTLRDKAYINEIAWYPRSLEFATLHSAKRQWAGVQRYNLHHFRLEGGE